MSLIDGVVALYNFENTWLDSSGNGLDIVNDGAVFDTVNKKLGVASAKYDGLNDFGNIGDKSEFENNDFTFHAWIRRTTIGNNHAVIAAQLQAAGAGLSGCLLRFGSDNTLSLFVVISNSFEVITTAATYTDTDKFYHIIAKKNGTAVEIKVDNISAKTGILTSSIVDYSTATSKRSAISGQWNGSISQFQLPHDGQIDAAYIWDRATTDAEDTQLWNSGAGLALPEVAAAAGRRRRMLLRSN